MEKVTAKEINDCLESSNRPTLYTNQPAPLNDLSDRAFEILLYSIFRERLKVKDVEASSIADNVSLMQGVGEQGRDVLLSKNGANTGVIQCKKYKSNFSLPEVSQEVLKFILYYLKDHSLIGNTESFDYFFAVSTGFTGTAIGAFNDFSDYLLNEPKLREWTEGLFKDYQSKFKDWNYIDIEQQLRQTIALIKVHKIIPPDIEYWLSQFEILNKQFFKVLTVTDNTLLEQIINSYLKPITQKLGIVELNSLDYNFRFKEYLKKAFDEYSSAKTLVFGNQQKKLEDIYYPLTLFKQPIIDKAKAETHKIDKYSDNFIPRYRKVIIVDDGGMGKSTLMKWLFLSIVKQNKGLPILIELRNINTDNTIIDFITHKLHPHDFQVEKSATSKVLAEKGFIFLLDGYDEIKFENREFVTNHIQEVASTYSTSNFVITSRPEKALLTFSDFQEFGIRKLEANEAFELIKKLDNYQERSHRLIQQIESKTIENIREFLGNPLLVSLLYKKFEYREAISFKKQEFYYEVFEALFQAHDLSKGGSYIREKECNLSLTDFFQILRGLGYKCIKEGIEFNESVLLQLIDATKEEFVKVFDSTLFLNDIVKAVPLFQRDGLSIKWAHKSIQQYFASEYICRDSKERQQKILVSLFRSDKIDSYFNILSLCYEIDYKTFRISVLYELCQDYISYYNSIFLNLKSFSKIDIDSIKTRSGLLFSNRFCLIKVKRGPKQTHDFSDDALLFPTKTKEIVHEKWNVKWSDIIYYSERIDGRLHLVVPVDELLNSNIKSFLFRQGDTLIESLDTQSSDIKISFKDPVFFFDNDDSENSLNTPLMFKRMNTLLSHFTTRFRHEKCEELIKEIESQMNNDNTLDSF